MSVLKNVSVTDYFEDALRRKLDIDYREVGRQGYQVGQGGMYIPPPPALQSQPTPAGAVKSNELGKELYELKDEKWTLKDEDRRISVLRKFIEKIASEHKFSGIDSRIEAAKLIMKQKELLKRAADEIGTEDEAHLYYWFKNEVDTQEKLREYFVAKEGEKVREREARRQRQKEKKAAQQSKTKLK